MILNKGTVSSYFNFVYRREIEDSRGKDDLRIPREIEFFEFR